MSVIRYALVGGVNTGVCAAVMALLNVLHAGARLAHVGGYALGMLCSFFLNRRWTFNTSEVASRQWLPFLMVVGFSYLISFLTLNDLLQFSKIIPVWIAQALSMVAYTLVSYVLNRGLFQPTPVCLSRRQHMIRHLIISFFVICLGLILLRLLHLFLGWHDWSRAPTYGRVDAWIHVAECFNQHRWWLMSCEGTNLVPFEEASLADDPGPAMLLSLISYGFNSSPSRELLVWIGLATRWIFLGISVFLLYALRYPKMMCFSVAFLGAVLVSSTHYVSADADNYYWSAWMGALWISWVLLAINQKEITARDWWGSWCLATFGLIYSLLMREPMGKIGIVLGLMTFVWMVIRRQSSFQNKNRWIAVLISIVLALLSPDMVYRIRQIQMPLHASSLYQKTHGVSHNLLIGLGAEHNSFGIRWDDASGLELAKKINPNVVSCTREYFDILWKAYWNIVIHHPLEVLGIYFKKFFKVYVKKILPLLMLMWVGYRLLKERFLSGLFEKNQIAYDSFMVVTTIAIIGTAAQGVLALPAWSYYYPIYFGFALMASMGIHFLWDWSGLKNNSNMPR